MLNEAIWEHRVNNELVNDWITQFQEAPNVENDEQIQALFLLSHFLYFGQGELRGLLRSMYRDLVRSPAIHDIRRANGNTLDRAFIQREYKRRLYNIRFLPIGNPSESSTHLLYYFRQENSLPKDLFINTHEIFLGESMGDEFQISIRHPEVDQYIFIDDLCGSGTASPLCIPRDIVDPLKDHSDKAKVSYLVLFATSQGLEAVRDLDRFDTVDAVYELDDTFKAFSGESRNFRGRARTFC